MKKHSFAWALLASLFLVIATGYFYVLMEWIFHVTKPSLLNILSKSNQATVLAFSALLAATLGAIANLVLAAVAWMSGLVARRPVAATSLLAVIPAGFLATTEFVLIDNFTHSVFGFSISGFRNEGRIVYAILLGFLFVDSFRFISRQLIAKHWERNIRVYVALVGLSLLVIAGLAAKTNGIVEEKPGSTLASVSETSGYLPNIVIFSGDGIGTRSMSAFGYHRETTPFIETLLSDSLVVNDHYVNSANTTGSVISMLTGRLPTRTRVYFRPDILRGADAYAHLPGILRRLGYYNADISIRHYVDARDINLRAGFHWGNGRELDEYQGFVLSFLDRVHPSTGLFVKEMKKRISDRLLHVLYLRDMQRPFELVAELRAEEPLNEEESGGDFERIASLGRAIDRAAERGAPLFANLHLMGTHGGYFYPKQRVFSKGQDQDRMWNYDFYDDAVLEFDSHVKDVVSLLKEKGIYGDTLLIINSDHAAQWRTREAVPLIFHFPKTKYADRVIGNSERVDIAPTVLDFIGQPIPDWMDGRSLLAPPRSSSTPIFISQGDMTGEDEKGWNKIEKPKPPFYTLTILSAVYCDRWYSMYLGLSMFSHGEVFSHSEPCRDDQVPTAEQGKELLVRHLEENGYDTSRFRERLDTDWEFAPTQ